MEELRSDYRGAEVVKLGKLLAVDGFLDARIIGQARGHDPQQVKKLWHLVAQIG